MTREEWLIKAVQKIDTEIFEGDLDTLNHGFQINCGIVPGKKLTNTIQPYEGEDVKLEDFFPTTISVSHTISDPIELLTHLTRECIFAFFNEKKINERTKKLLEKYYFLAPFSSCNPSDYLKDIIAIVYKQMRAEYGEFPGSTVILYPKEKKDAKKNTLVMFCPECGYEIKVSRKMHEKHGQGMPTCVCGSKMGLDCEDETEIEGSEG
jgi:hypothetical protein